MTTIKDMRKHIFFIAGCLCSLAVWAQPTVWKGKTWECKISEKGTLEHIVFKTHQGNDTIPFFTQKGNAGPTFYAQTSHGTTVAEWIPDGERSYRSAIDGVLCRLNYKEWRGQPAIEVTLENRGNIVFQPVKAGLKLGVDTYMDKFPDWFGKFFPTLLMNEKTHFYGYMQTPSGKTLGLLSPNPIASWSVDYNLGYQDPPPHWFMGHRIESLNIDLMNALPLPSHNPQNLWQLQRGESRTWIIAFMDVEKPESFEQTLHQVGGVPMLRMAQTSWEPLQTASFEVLGKDPSVTVKNDMGEQLALTVAKKSGDVRTVSVKLPAVGLYDVNVTDGGLQVHGTLTAHASWQWTMERARENAWRYHQKATSHIESWYGFYSAFLAAKYFPEKQLDQQLRSRFDYLFDKLHDTGKMEPLYHVSRIQNTSGTINLLVNKYKAYGDVADLKKAARLADWLISTWQRQDGAYVNHNTVYTSVIYVAKNILELVLEERELGKASAEWKTVADRHYESAKRAIDQLVASQGNFETEGEMTFEDGMISCSALQVGMLGLMQTDPAQRRHYTDAMMQILQSHDCLAQLRVPDARRRGGTMRYWEAQYDVQMLPNMFNSPHGWSGWRAYATYYAYLLTGDERWLQESYNAMGAFSNLIDYRNGNLRWAFVVDPYLQVKQACSADSHVTEDSLSFGNPHPELYDTREFVIGEQYVDMVSDWQTINTQDNDVHELFKFLGEALLTNAFVVEQADGTIKSYNCSATRQGKTLKVKVGERQITNLHCNLKSAWTVSFNGKTRTLPSGFCDWAFGKNIYQP